MAADGETRSGVRNDARSKIENKWPEILQELHIPLSDKEASVEDKLSHILKNLRDDGGNKISSSRLEAAVAQVIGRQYRQEVVQLIRNAERNLSRNCKNKEFSSPSSWKNYGATNETPNGESHQQVKYPNTCLFTQRKKRNSLVAIIAGILIVSAFLVTVSTFSALFAVNPTHINTMWVQEGDTVVAAKADAFWYKEIVLNEMLLDGDSDHSIDAWVLPCSGFEVKSNLLKFLSRTLHIYYETFLLGEQPGKTPIYLLSGSKITYRFLIWANITLSTPPMFYILNSNEAFQSFIRGKMDVAALHRQQLAVGTPENPALTEVSFTVKSNGYYYMTGYSKSGISYQFNATEYVLYLNTSDYKGKYPTCHFSSGDSCSLATDGSFLGKKREYCLIAHINQPYSEDPPSTHIHIESRKRSEVLVFVVIPAAVSIAVVVVGIPIMIIAVYRKRWPQSPRYTTIQ